jgi:hypothetical protein
MEMLCVFSELENENENVIMTKEFQALKNIEQKFHVLFTVHHDNKPQH